MSRVINLTNIFWNLCDRFSFGSWDLMFFRVAFAFHVSYDYVA